MAAMAADHIITQNSSLVGSIGVLFQYPNLTDLLDKIGVKMEEIKSSPLKAAPNGLEPTSPQARAAIESLVSDSFAWFKDIVKERRKLDGEALDRVTDGRVFTGRQAIDSNWLTRSAASRKPSIGWPRRTTSIRQRRCETGGLAGASAIYHFSILVWRKFLILSASASWRTKWKRVALRRLPRR